VPCRDNGDGFDPQISEFAAGIRLADALLTRGGHMRNLNDQKGKIGYIILWFLGVPASVLFLIFLLRGCT